MYNWDFVLGIETIVNWCRAHGVKIMFTFLDNWSTVDSKSAVRCSASIRTSGLRLTAWKHNPTVTTCTASTSIPLAAESQAGKMSID